VSELEHDLVEHLRQVLAERPTTEAELRSLSVRAHELEQTLAGERETAEARLSELSRQPDSSIAETAGLLRRAETARVGLDRIRAVLDNLDERSRRLRTGWLLGQAGSAPGDAQRAQPVTSTNATDDVALGRPRAS